MNILICNGRIGKDAEIRTTPSGKTVCSFPVAVDDGWGDNKTTTWWNCSIWGKQAEGGLVPYLKKGAQVLISGNPSFRKYESAGENRESKDLRVIKLDLIGGRPSETPQQADRPASQPTHAGEFAEHEIPF